MKKVNSKAKSVKKKRKLFLAILMILFTGVVLTASTYAWFTSNRNVSVEAIDVNVAAADGLQISVDAVEWKSVITKSDITSSAASSWEGSNNYVPTGTIMPVSTVGAVDENGYMKFYKGTIINQKRADGLTYANMLTATLEEEKKGESAPNFVAFDLFFKLPAGDTATNIYLSSGSSVIAGNVAKNIEYASRVAFVVQGNIGTTVTDMKEIYSKKASAIVANGKNDNVYIWEPNYDRHTTTSINHAVQVYGLQAPLQDNATALDYYGVKNNIADSHYVELKYDSSNQNHINSFGLMNSETIEIRTPDEYNTATNYQTLFTLNPGITKVRIYLWIEGQDVDCEDSASGGDLLYNLQFSLDDKAN